MYGVNCDNHFLVKHVINKVKLHNDWFFLQMFNPLLPKEGDSYHPLEDFFQAAKTLGSATKWLQLIVGSSFVAILARKGVGGRVCCQN